MHIVYRIRVNPVRDRNGRRQKCTMHIQGNKLTIDQTKYKLIVYLIILILRKIVFICLILYDKISIHICNRRFEVTRILPFVYAILNFSDSRSTGPNVDHVTPNIPEQLIGLYFA